MIDKVFCVAVFSDFMTFLELKVTKIYVERFFGAKRLCVKVSAEFCAIVQVGLAPCARNVLHQCARSAPWMFSCELRRKICYFKNLFESKIHFLIEFQIEEFFYVVPRQFDPI